MEGQDTCGKGGNCYWSSSCLWDFGSLCLLALGVYSLRLAISKTIEGWTVMTKASVPCSSNNSVHIDAMDWNRPCPMCGEDPRDDEDDE